MKIRSESRIAYPREQVYLAYRDRLPDIASFIADIERIDVVSRTQTDEGVRLHNSWYSKTEIPAVVSKFIRPEHLRWDDHADWNDSGFYVDWTIKTHAFTEAVRCSGRNEIIEEGDGTLVRLTGDLQVNLKEIRGVPSFLAKRLAPQVEKFIVTMITPNLEETNASIQRFLDSEGAL